MDDTWFPKGSGKEKCTYGNWVQGLGFRVIQFCGRVLESHVLDDHYWHGNAHIHDRFSRDPPSRDLVVSLRRVADDRTTSQTAWCDFGV